MNAVLWSFAILGVLVVAVFVIMIVLLVFFAKKESEDIERDKKTMGEVK